MKFSAPISNSSGTRQTCLFRINRDKTLILDFLGVKILCLLPSYAMFISFIHNSHMLNCLWHYYLFFFFLFWHFNLVIEIVVHNERGWWAMLPSHVLAVSVHMLSPFVVCRYHLWPCFRTLVLQPSWSRGHLQGRWATSTEECRLFNCYYIMKSMMWSFNSSSKNLKLYQLLFICSEDYANC